MYYFTADTHFGHENVIKMCNRPFASIDDMNEEMIKRWNAKVKGNDVVYIIGDMFFRCSNPEDILRRLKGKKRLIQGNHDGSWISRVNLKLYFESVENMVEFSDGERGLMLCHYPMLTWKHAKKNYMIHGHIHKRTQVDYWPLLKARERVLNAGVDINNFEPVSFEELVANNIRYKLEN